MANQFPTSLNNYTGAETDAAAGHAQAHNAVEAKLGIDSSAVTTSIDYKLKNASSIDPGHHHTNSTLDSIASTKVSGVTFPASGIIVGTTDTQTLTGKTLTAPKIDLIKDTNGNPAAIFTANASAVNGLTFDNAATTFYPIIKATGSDTNIDLGLKGKGTGAIRFGTAGLALPNADGSAGQVLKTDGAGTLSFSSDVNFATSGPVASFSSASTSYVDVTGATVTINPTASAKVHVVISGRLYNNNGSAADTFVQLMIDGVAIQSYSVRPNTSSLEASFCVSGQATVSSGSRVIKLQAKVTTGTGTWDQANVNVIYG